MYYTVKRKNARTRAIGVSGVAVALFGAGYAIANGFGLIENKAPIESEVVIIEQQEEVKDEPPPPPPVDVDLPPPPPQVILPDFVFDTPPPENQFKTLAVVPTPAPPPPPAPPKAAPPPPPVLRSKPKTGRRFKAPDYPASSRRAGESGNTVVAMCVDKDGRTSNVRIVRSSGFERLDDAAVKGLNNNRLDPAIDQYGKPIEMCDPNPYVLTYEWNLKDAH